MQAYHYIQWYKNEQGEWINIIMCDGRIRQVNSDLDQWENRIINIPITCPCGNAVIHWHCQVYHNLALVRVTATSYMWFDQEIACDATGCAWRENRNHTNINSRSALRFRGMTAAIMENVTSSLKRLFVVTHH